LASLLLLLLRERIHKYVYEIVKDWEAKMKKSILIALICAMVLMISLPAMSYAWGRGGYGYGRGYHHGRGYYGRGWGPPGGFILGAAIGSALALPLLLAPPPVYVAPPPPAVYYYPSPRPYRAYAYPY
jgi:hypothetical protein